MNIRVVITDDSPFTRELLREGLARFPNIQIVGEASDGQRAIEMAKRLKPDVITMDLLMPMMDGVEAIQAIMAACPTPIIVVAEVGTEGRCTAASAAGAVAVFPKPEGGFTSDQAAKLAKTIEVAARTRVASRGASHSPPAPKPPLLSDRVSVIGIVASSGGPPVLRAILEQLPPAFEVPIAVVQHTSPGFTEGLAKWLKTCTGVDVRVAQNGPLSPGTVVFAPDQRHLIIDAGPTARLVDAPLRDGHRPSGTLLLESMSQSHPTSCIGIVCTGIGRDGAAGLRAIEEMGGIAVVQQPQTAAFPGMPIAASQRCARPTFADPVAIGKWLASAKGVAVL